jgi:hypothetical protein
VALELLEGFSLIQKKVHLLDGEWLDPEQVLQALEHFVLLYLRRRRAVSSLGYAVHDNDSFFVIDLLEAHLHDFRVTGLNAPPNEASLDRQAQPHPLRPA